MIRIPLSLILVASLAACATSNPDVVPRNEAQRLSTLQDATVLSVRTVRVDGNQSGAGAVAGGVVGGIAGSSVGGRRESTIVGVLGAVAGAAIGNAIERSSTQEDSLEIIVQLRNGDRRSLIQAKGKESFEPGDAIIIVTTNGKSRVMHAPPVQAMPR